MGINMKEAVGLAAEAVLDLFGDQKVSDVLLEEVSRDPHRNFAITIGFERQSQNRNFLTGGLGQLTSTQRVYKVVIIDPESGEIQSVKDRMLERQ